MSQADRIYHELERRIRSGELAPGTQIPFEQDLAQSHGCARATANKALARLAREGLIDRRRKAGSFVAQPVIRSAILNVPDMPTVVGSRGQSYGWQLLIGPLQDHPDTGSDADGESWLHWAGVHLADARPFAHELRWIACDTVPEVSTADFATEAPGTWLLRTLPWTQARHRVRAVAPSSAVRRALQVKAGAPCLQLERWTWRSERAVTYARFTFPGDKYDLDEAFAPGPMPARKD